jgi:hypothetical protein
MAEEYFGLEDHEADAPGRDHLFLWTVFILLLIGMAFACWLGSFYIFGHPEKPRPYRILKKLGKIDAPRRFEVTAAPPGEFLTAQKLFERYSRYSRLKLEEENDELMRDYIKNYRETKKLVPYVSGRFEIIDSFELQKSDLFPSGVVAFASSTDFSQVLLEHVFTTSPQNVAGLRANLPRGLDMRLERTRDLAAVVHIERTNDGYLQFTAVPLLYGSWGVKGSVGVFSLEPPPELNLAAGAPIVRGQVRLDAMRAYAEYRRERKPPVAADEADRSSAPPEPELVRLDSLKPGTAVPETGPVPVVPVATPIPMGRPGGPIKFVNASPSPRPRATPITVASLTDTTRPLGPRVATPIPVATPIAAASPPPGLPKGVIKPFVSTIPLTNLVNSSTRDWPTYGPGKAPAGRNVNLSEARALAAHGELSERLYLDGDFVVTAAGQSRAVLRSRSAMTDSSQGTGGSARVIVEYPSSIAPPAEGSSFTRDEKRGFEIVDVRPGPDGQINIYVREITQPE